MGKKLQINLFKILVLFLVLSSTQTILSYGQVPLVDLRSFEISFTSEESNLDKDGVKLSMQEAKQMSGLEIDDGQPFRFTSSPDNQKGFYYVDTRGGASLGRYYHSGKSNVVSQLPVRNGTPHNIAGVSIAFDFVYKPAQTKSEINYQLSYKVNDGRWISPSGGFFTSDIFQAKEESWNSFSMQIMLDQLYLLPNDHLYIRWTATDTSEGNSFIPLALQKIEIFAKQAEPKEIHSGSLIISEIMPAFETESGKLEYVELYNSTENPINLKGLVLQSGENRIVVQRNVIAEPYKPIVLTGSSENNSTTYNFTDYHYSEPLVETNSGSLSLIIDGNDVARALFGSSKSGTAVQMDNLANAFDGYSGLSHFEPATEEWSRVFSGTPGHIEPESHFYSKTITKSGWYLLEPPGQLSDALNRELSPELASLKDKSAANDTDKAIPPYIYFHPSEADPVRVYASGQSDGESQSDQRKSERHAIFQEVPLVSLSITHQSMIRDIITQEGNQGYPALLTWSNSSQQFELVWQEEDTLSPWNSYMASGEAEVMLPGHITDSNRKNVWSGLTRSVVLSLVSDADKDSEAIEYDRSLIGFWESPSQDHSTDFSLPKLWTPLEESRPEERDPMLYFKSADTAYPANSYLNFSFTPKELLQVPVGLKLPAAINSARFVWDSIETLPEQWELELVDAELGEKINMREERSYSFFERSEVLREGMNDPDHSFKPVEKVEYNRFYIRISSTGDLGKFEDEGETPESIKLKQNYPNPFNPTTTIGFYVPKATDVQIGVYNVVGQQVGQLVDERLGPGDHTITWNAMDMPSGVYIVQMEAMNTVQTRKITLIK
ncbi:T9SS type A sorting domain-containing protein [Rhodohalobacter sp. 8-1]|uniref:T9SS type A sorting domain-containing protein n=1 Tax=Rhodohalobacter sp. 8-1 TaxID=3131972 RepID=UPI0030EBAD5B